MLLGNNYRISVGDDSEHEDLTAEIYFEETFLAMLSQEHGFEHLQLEIFPNPNKEQWVLSLEEFFKVVEAAKQRLWELRRI